MWQIFSRERTTPFAQPTQQQTFSKIVACSYELPDSPQLTEEASDLIQRLLVKDPRKRIGVLDFQELIDHPFFEDFEFDTCYDIEAPLTTR